LSVVEKKAIADLKDAYQRIVGILPTNDRQRLKVAECAWLAYRDQTCVAERAL